MNINTQKKAQEHCFFFNAMVFNIFLPNLFLHSFRTQLLKVFTLLLFCGLGSTLFSSCSGDYGRTELVYMSYEELRGPLKIEYERTPKENGKLYIYQDYLFINEPNQGVHIYDNSDPANPKQLYFLVIPGNLDMAVRNSYLYVDSFIDLVTIDLTDINNPTISDRDIDIFPYNPYQAVRRYYPDSRGYNKEYGVIIGTRYVSDDDDSNPKHPLLILFGLFD